VDFDVTVLKSAGKVKSFTFGRVSLVRSSKIYDTFGMFNVLHTRVFSRNILHALFVAYKWYINQI